METIVQIGKLLVFDDGAVKLQMGDVLLDVTAGTPCHFRQEVAAVNAKDAHFIFLGDVAQRVVCSPNIEQLIRSVLLGTLAPWVCLLRTTLMLLYIVNVTLQSLLLREPVSELDVETVCLPACQLL